MILPPARRLVVCIAALFTRAMSVHAQPPLPVLTLSQALDAARQVSPDVQAAREAVAAAEARQRQAHAYPNPTLSYGREQTSVRGSTSWQNIAALEQRIELGSIRSARGDAAQLRREAARARLEATEAQLAFDVTRAYAQVLASERRSDLAAEAAQAFSRALSVSQQRLAAGDVSGYAHRRIRLEAARYTALRTEAALAFSTARHALAALTTPHLDSIRGTERLDVDSLMAFLPNAVALPSQDSLVRLALRSRADLRALSLDVSIAEAETRLASAERVPIPALSVGFKNERTPSGTETASGFVAGITIPLAVWDRRAGAVGAADAETRRRRAEVAALERRISREVAEAYDSYLALSAQLDALEPQLGREAASAMSAVQVAYAEGEVTVVEWLDAVRAYHEAESSFATLRADALIRRAALERAVGSLLSQSPNNHGDAASSKD